MRAGTGSDSSDLRHIGDRTGASRPVCNAMRLAQAAVGEERRRLRARWSRQRADGCSAGALT
ncbi:hypothetical protein DGN21_15695 [Xanthomonas sp. MLO165]|nr:hypothetical protein DGN21_15695 [Xanthomonas sp. MLO165]